MNEAQQVARLVAHALNSLGGDDDLPCCAAECAPCAALKAYHDAGVLSDRVRPYVASSSDGDPGWDWWEGSVASGGVRWEWVTARMCVNPAQCLAPLHCLAHPPESERSVKTYTAVAKRWERGWELYIDGVGTTQTEKLSDAEAMVRDYVSLALDVAPDSFDVEIALLEGETGT